MNTNINPYTPSPCVYVISDEHNRIKIGSSTCFADRIISLKTGNADILSVIRVFFVDKENMFELERRLHRLCSSHRISKDCLSTEWFTDSALKIIRKIRCDTFDDLKIKDIYRKEYDKEFSNDKFDEYQKDVENKIIVEYLTDRIEQLEFDASQYYANRKEMSKRIEVLEKEVDEYSEMVSLYYMMEDYLADKNMLIEFYEFIGEEK